MRREDWPKGTWMELINREFFKATIKQRNLSYYDVGEMAHCHKSMIGQLASGHRKSCSPDLAGRIARCLGVPRGLLFDERASAASGHIISGERIAS